MSLLKRFLWDRWYAHFIKLKIIHWCSMILKMKSKFFTLIWNTLLSLTHLIPLSPLLIVLQPFWPSFCSFNMPSIAILFVWNAFSPPYLPMASHLLTSLPQLIWPPPFRGLLRPLNLKFLIRPAYHPYPVLFSIWHLSLFHYFLIHTMSLNYAFISSRDLIYFIHPWSTLPRMVPGMQ